VRAYLASVPAGSPLAFAVTGEEGGELVPPTVGLAWRKGEGRAASFSFLDELRPVLEDASAPKIAHDVKSVLLRLARAGVEARGFDQDVMLYAFLLEADPAGCALEQLAQRRLDRKPGAAPEEHATCALELAAILGGELDSQGLRDLYLRIDLPLIPVLARMERAGVRVEAGVLAGLSTRMDADIQRLSEEICHLAGRTFNINSPQQLGKVLFEELRLPAPARSGKSKTISRNWLRSTPSPPRCSNTGSSPS
jgi:DNA polymerase-1